MDAQINIDAQNLINQITSFQFDGGAAPETARNEFLTKFPESRIATLSDDEYNGGKNNDSFCYNLEFKPDLPFGIGGRSKKKFGRTNNIPALTKGIASMIADARSGNVKDLRNKHGLGSISQDVLIKILSIYLPESFLTIGQEYPLILLGRILQITPPTDDLIELNNRCMKALCDANPLFSDYEYSRLGDAIWSILHPKHKKGFEDWLRKQHGATGTISSYTNSIAYLSYYFHENLYSDSIALARLQFISEDTAEHQKENGGMYYYSAAPSYGKNGHYSAAVNEYIRYRFGISLKSEDHVQETDHNDNSLHLGKMKSKQFVHNTILYGPPGTGKTYNAIRYAVSIINGYNAEAIFDNKTVVDGKTIKEHFDEYLEKGQIRFTTFHQSLSYEDFIEGIKPEFDKVNNVLTYPVKPGIFKEICIEAEKEENKDKKYVLIIDEINRGNVAQIFGELITLIEEDKRQGADNAIPVILPYSPSNGRFSVPANLYLLGTMNTADRSVEALDSALRRRFKFVEMMPNVDRVPESVEGLDASPKSILKKINERIEVLKDSDHQIGHSYFMKVETVEDLMSVFRYNIIPLLKEYFYGDMERIRMVLGEGFFETKKNIKNSLFPNYKGDVDFPEEILQIWGDAEWDACVKDSSHAAFVTAINTLL